LSKNWFRSLGLLLILSLALIIPSATQADTYDSTLTLENKNPDTWQVLPDNEYGTLHYNPSGPTFDFSFTGVGLEPSTAYSLIYYANPWPGNNPGASLGTGTSGTDGALTIIGSPNLNISLPTPPDSNMAVSHEGPPDNYIHPFGAKIWLVPSACYDTSTKAVSSWEPNRFLFETDLITYTDTDLVTGGTGVPLTTTITEPAAEIGLSVSPPSVTFGSVAIGTCSTNFLITLTNTGNVPIKVTASTSAGYYTDCLRINGVVANGWVSQKIPVGGSLSINTQSCPTIAYNGTVTGSIAFVASFAP